MTTALAVAAPEALATPMRAAVRRQYGPPSVLSMGEQPRPAPAAGEVLVRVRAAGVTIGDHHMVTGTPYLIRLTPFGGLPGPKHAVPGALLAGVVDAVGAGVADLRPGDEVLGQAQHGAWAEYVVVNAQHVARKPSNLSFEEAAVVPWGATALQGLRDVARLQPGQRVLVNGAAGGVGLWTVQVAKALGAHVTAVCSTRSVELVRSLGADEVVDYTKEDFTRRGGQYDVMMDLVGNHPLSTCRTLLAPKAVYLPCFGGGGDFAGPMVRILGGVLTSLFSGKKVKTFVMAPNRADLETLRAMVESGKAKPVIERTSRLDEVVAVLDHVGAGHTRGQSVVRI
ncbi:MAG: NAD(P)-dependent alcohol dehydrogenase [Myxococcaceae bacterium]|nr:NAD(P)-dependent alcohol dehydrogenase [Myxococcaceae bacterium]